ncbi:MAG: putative aminodeoxychorismate lyase [Firmicutes bacterium ADurb.BinA052]|nr:MAG: putative aminodeoxychorismate lyase [Firmicutes bacterium ADurb.BinA052]
MGDASKASTNRAQGGSAARGSAARGSGTCGSRIHGSTTGGSGPTPAGRSGIDRRPRGRLGLAAMALAAIVLAATGLALLVASGLFVAGHRGERVVVSIPERTPASQIAAILQREGLISSERLFKLAVRASGKASSLKSGQYEFIRGDSMVSIIERISLGRVMTIKITVPEGMTAKQVAKLMGDRGLASEDDMIVLIDNPPEQVRTGFPFIPEGASLEGYLFPDTYEFASGVGATKVIRTMLRRFENAAQAALNAADATTTETTAADGTATEPRAAGGGQLPSGLTQREALILASIVEREARIESERPIIAGVFLNRLDRSMPLQSCATVQYILPATKERLLNKDLEIESPYNTYLVAGLPPGPICNPGLASIRAVLEPEPGDYLYFVASSDGSHVFSRTYSEHLHAKAGIEREARLSRQAGR